MSLEVRQFPCLSDNYGFLVRDRETGLAASIDAPDADAVLTALKEAGWGLALILNTHWHPDHAGGNAAVTAATGARVAAPAEVARIAPVDQVVADGDEVSLGETRFQVLGTGGHTLGHVSYYAAESGLVFVGDTLFAMGCGRLFEGTPAQMWGSLSRLAALPVETRVYCAHEYTAANARFALSVDDDPAVARRAETVFAARARGEATVPTTIGLERATNPFLRAERLAPRLVPGALDPAAAFAALRTAKDDFRG
jgi:hydroxyacylglutathione hydrolase